MVFGPKSVPVVPTLLWAAAITFLLLLLPAQLHANL